MNIPLNQNAKIFLNQTVIIAIPKQKESSKNKIDEDLNENIIEPLSFKNEKMDENYFGNFYPNPLHILKPCQN